MIESLKEAGVNPYPHKFNVTMTVARYIRMFNTLEAGEQREYDVLSLAGKEFCVYNGVLSGSFLVLTHLNPVCFCFVREELCRRECYRQS